MSRLVRFIVLSLTAISIASAQPSNVAPVATLTLEDAIVRALQKNFSLQIESYDTVTAEAQVDLADSDFDPSFSVNATKNLNQQASPGSILDGTNIVGPRTD
ncbi:MAG: hypothetical protein ACKVI3_12050, partial [Verrucomicrobiia bacterium]